MRSYTIVLSQEPDDGRWNVSVPALDGCFTYGNTIEHAMDMAREAIAGYLLVLKERGDVAPADTPTMVVTVEVLELAASAAS
jgi:antitoxin HicB